MSVEPVVAAVDWTEILVASIGALPQVLAMGVVGAFILMNRDILRPLLERISGLSAGPFQVSFASLAESANAGSNTTKEIEPLEERATEIVDHLVGSRVLWVDDRPKNNLVERRALRQVGIEVVTALTTEEVRILLDRDEFDLLITDQDRPESPSAGTELVDDLRRAGETVPAIGYVGFVDKSRGVPAGFSAFTAVPEDLLRAVFDVLESGEPGWGFQSVAGRGQVSGRPESNPAPSRGRRVRMRARPKSGPFESRETAR